MKIKTITFLLSLFFVFNARSQSFDNLAHTSEFGSDIKYDSNQAILIFEQVPVDGPAVYDLIKVKINSKDNFYYKIQFDEGPSDDPSYSILKINTNGSEEFLGNIGCEKIIIPGNGYIYTEGEMNKLYYQKQKFKIENNKVVEVPQAAYYIGLQSKTRTLVTLYAKKNKTVQAAVLPQNYEVEVVIEEDGWFLIKTAFGLTGWISKQDIQTYPPSESTFEGLYYRGD